MDDLGFNKLAAAGLMTALAFIGVRSVADIVVPESDFSTAYAPEVQLETAGGAEEPADPGFNHPDFIAAMDVARGEKVFKKCQSCHNAEPGGANGTGPALYGVMGRQMGVHPGFAYSAAMQGKAAPWTWEEMNGFLIKPKEWLPGTAMNYIGLKKWEDRAAVMAYLNTTTNNPLPMPDPVLPEADEVVDVVAEEGELPSSSPGSTVLMGEDGNDEGMLRVVDEPQVEGIPGQTGGAEALAVNDGGEGADDATLEDIAEAATEGLDTEAAEADLPSAGELGDTDVKDAVAEAIAMEEPEDEGPMDAQDVLDFLGGDEQ